MERVYKFNNSFIKVLFGDITGSDADIIVSSIAMYGGVSPMIRKEIGPSVFSEIKKHVPANYGDVIVTGAGELSNKYIFHVVTVGRKKLSLSSINTHIDANPSVWRFMIENSINKCFRLMQALDLSSIAFPALGAGAAHIPYEEIASNMIRTLSDNLVKTNKSIMVELYLYNRYKNKSEWDFLPFFEKIGKYLPENEAVVSYFPEKVTGNTTKSINDSTFVFISYSRKDIEKARDICKVLNNSGIDYWIDEEGKYSGHNYKGVIVERIQKSSVVLFLSSEASNCSNNVVKEIGVAVRYSKPIILIKLDNSSYDVSIEYDLCNIDYIEYSQDEAFRNKMLDNIFVHMEMH